MTTLNYTIHRGETWERLVIIKDRRTRRKRVPTTAAASLRSVSTLGVATKHVIPVTITSEGGVLMSMSTGNTEWLAVGDYPWDMVVTVSRSALLTSTPLVETLLVRGTLSVLSYDNITPMASDGVSVPLAAVV